MPHKTTETAAVAAIHWSRMAQIQAGPPTPFRIEFRVDGQWSRYWHPYRSVEHAWASLDAGDRRGATLRSGRRTLHVRDLAARVVNLDTGEVFWD